MQSRRGSGAMRLGGIGGGAGLVVALIVFLMGGNPLDVLRMLVGGGGAEVSRATESGGPALDDEMGQYLSTILAMTEDVWTEIFAAAGVRYVEPTLILFSGGVESACGYSSAATGPFYCPADQSLYLDTSFFQELARMGGPGDFAQAYVVGHEVGHHVQTLVGTSDWVRDLQQQGRSETEANRLQVLMELQADCYAGVWANHANRRQQILEPGDVPEGMAAAAAIGDDRLRRRAGMPASPETFTHGSSEQRQDWLKTGLQSGDVDACDTFGKAGIQSGR